MPELPEVESIKRYLEKEIIGQKILKVKVLNQKSFYGDKRKIIDKKILFINRRGKILIFRLENNLNLVFHLKMSGQLIFIKEKLNNFEKQTRVAFILSGGTLIFNDFRKFGWVKILNDKEFFQEIKKLGPEPFSKEFNFNYLKNIFSKTKRAIKIVLMDQTKIAGIGNIYANEALFLAKVNPKKPANKLNYMEIKNLLKAIKIVLKRGIKYQGVSLRMYLKPDQTKGGYQEKLLIYQQKNCYFCKSTIKKIILGGRSTFYCSKCQK